jgi:TonB family protein
MGLLTILLAAVLSVDGNGFLRAGKDVPVPERVHYVPPEHPLMAREMFPPVMGVIVLDVGLSEEGRPIDIKVLRGTPLIDAAAIEAVKQWRYKPTLVAGSPRQVVVLEVVDVFPDEGSRVGYFLSMLKNEKAPRAYRLLAIQRLTAVGAKRKSAMKALQKAADDPDEQVGAAASDALKALGASVK